MDGGKHHRPGGGPPPKPPLKVGSTTEPLGDHGFRSRLQTAGIEFIEIPRVDRFYPFGMYDAKGKSSPVVIRGVR
jgi:hypothetical protein